MNKLRCSSVASSLAVACSFGLGCGGDDDEAGRQVLDASVCHPEQGPFSIVIDNEWFPLPVGRVLVLEGEDEDGVLVRVEMTVLDETERVAGVTTRVVEEAEFEDGEIVEVSRNFFAQAADRTVCYYGEDVDDYQDGEIVDHEGAWRAGEGDNQPGIIMPGAPVVGMEFAQEQAPEVAEDRSAITAVEESMTVPAGAFDDVVLTVDWNPLDGDTRADGEPKAYAAGVGLIQDDVIELVDE